MELAGAELLGRDVAQHCSQQVLDQIRSLLKSELDLERLVNQMAQAMYAEARPAVERTVIMFRRGLLGDEK